MNKLTTRWGKTVDAALPLAEYPRPGMVRDNWLCLNGSWDYAITKTPAPDGYTGKILVPFSPEAPLSGVEHILQPDEYLHYRRFFALPETMAGKRVLLHFGAVDQECRVFLNGSLLGEHIGGYLPFTFDITEHLQPGENELTLTVTDATETSAHARGKQQLVRKGICESLFYTPQSGIWQTVWLEAVPAEYVKQLTITPLFDEACVEVTVHASDNAPVRLQVVCGGTAAAEKEGFTNEPVRIELPDFQPWSPACPHLYDLTVTLEEDKVQSYFGMRKFSAGRDKKGILRFYLNNKPFFFNGILDQGYWPDGLLTAPSDAALLYDIEKIKALGFNTIRKHIKVEPERFYYHCDRLGMIVWQDMPNGGGSYNMNFVTYLPNVGGRFVRHISDKHYKLFHRTDEAGRRQYYTDLEGMVRHLYNCTCLAVWVPFNEGWGQFDATKATALVRSLDTTRLINEACGWFDQGGGDMYSIHNYFFKLKVSPKDRVVALTEYGGYAHAVEGHTMSDVEFGYQKHKSREALTAAYEKLWEEQIFPNLKKGLSSAIYTQTSDVENELNGLMTYDRETDKLLADRLQALNERLYREFDALCAD